MQMKECYQKYICLLLFIVSLLLEYHITLGAKCGCKGLRPCYAEMLDNLQDMDEVACIEEASIGTHTLIIFLKALQDYCGEYIKVISNSYTYEGRLLHEVVLSSKAERTNRPVILIEAGQAAGDDSVELALYVIEQLVACEEYTPLVEKVRWVILPCTNPDGMEYSRFFHKEWTKNRRATNGLYVGTDLTRNFDHEFQSCDRPTSGFANTYAGEAAGSENETIFINRIFEKYGKQIKAYLSIRRDGHGIYYSYGNSKKGPSNKDVQKVAADFAAKVNQRAVNVQPFGNSSIFELNGRPHCGHSVDFAHQKVTPFSYEFRVFLSSDNDIVSQFQTLPHGNEAALRIGYFAGIRELYNMIINKKYEDLS